MSIPKDTPTRVLRAGLAWVVAESSRHHADLRTVHLRAHHWAVMRDLPIGTTEAHEEAVEDAIRYAEAHEADVAEFKRLMQWED
jgi:hypothetical protein